MSITPEGDFTYYPFPDYEQHIAAEPFVYMTITPNWLTPGSTFEVVWEAYGAESCSAGGEWAGTQATRGKFQNSFSEEGTYTYTLTCSNGNGSTYVEREVTVDWGPPQSPQNPQNPEGGETTDENERTTYGLAGSVVALRVQTQTTGNHLYYMHGNHLGSMTVITDENGDVVDEARYYPFGKYRVAPTEDLTDIGYTGHRHNADIGLIYMGARYYDPTLRRFISADTIIPNMLNTKSFNRFSYVQNNPINRNVSMTLRHSSLEISEQFIAH